MKKAYSYVRFSRGHQKRTSSYVRQMALTEAYCRSRPELVLDRELYFDSGVSAYTGRNARSGALSRFLEATRSGVVPRGSALIVESIDRLSRQSPRKTVALLNEFLDLGIEIHTLNPNYVLTPDSDREGLDLIFVAAISIRAHEESRLKSSRLRDAWDRNRKNVSSGKRAILTPFLPWWLTIEDNRIVSPEDRRTVVEDIFKLTAEGYSSAAVARMLNKQKTPTWRKSSRWTSARIRGLVRSDAPLGKLRETPKTAKSGVGYQLDGYYPAIITPQVAAAARATLERNLTGSRGRSNEGDRPINLFRGLLRFRGHYLRHATMRNGLPGADGRKTYNGYYECYQEHEQKLIFTISAKQLEPVVLASLLELKASDLSLKTPRTPPKSSMLAGEIRTLEERRDNLLKAIESGSTSVAARLVEIESDIARKRRDLTAAELQESSPVQIPKQQLLDAQKSLSEPKTREALAAALRRLLTGIHLARNPSELPALSNRKFRISAARILSQEQTRTFPDPVPPTKRRKPIWLQFDFPSGAHRIVARVSDENSLATFRVEET